MNKIREIFLRRRIRQAVHNAIVTYGKAQDKNMNTMTCEAMNDLHLLLDSLLEKGEFYITNVQYDRLILLTKILKKQINKRKKA